MLILRAMFLSAAVLAVSGCGGRGEEEERVSPRPRPRPRPEPQPVREPVPEPAEHPDKYVRVHFSMSPTTIVGRKVEIGYGTVRSRVADPDLFRALLVGRGDTSLVAIKTYDPRARRIYPNTNPKKSTDSLARLEERGARPIEPVRPIGPAGPGRPRAIAELPVELPFAERQVMEDSVTVEMDLPFHYRVRAVRFTDPQGKEYGRVGLADGIEKFCAPRVADDPGCRAWTDDVRRFGR